jgi:hypothetical protein
MVNLQESKIENSLEGIYSVLDGGARAAFLEVLQGRNSGDWSGLHQADEAWLKSFSEALYRNDCSKLSALGAFAKTSTTFQSILESKNHIALYGFLQHNVLLEAPEERLLLDVLASLGDIVLTALALEGFLWSSEGYTRALELFREILPNYPIGISCPVGRYPELYDYDFLKFCRFPIRGERQAWRLNVLSRLSQFDIELPKRYRNFYGETLSVVCSRKAKTRVEHLMTGAMLPTLIRSNGQPMTIQELVGQELFAGGKMYKMRRFLSPVDWGYLDSFRSALAASGGPGFHFFTAEGKPSSRQIFDLQKIRALGDSQYKWAVFIEILRNTSGDISTAIDFVTIMGLYDPIPL